MNSYTQQSVDVFEGRGVFPDIPETETPEEHANIQKVSATDILQIQCGVPYRIHSHARRAAEPASTKPESIFR